MAAPICENFRKPPPPPDRSFPWRPLCQWHTGKPKFAKVSFPFSAALFWVDKFKVSFNSPVKLCCCCSKLILAMKKRFPCQLFIAAEWNRKRTSQSQLSNFVQHQHQQCCLKAAQRQKYLYRLVFLFLLRAFAINNIEQNHFMPLLRQWRLSWA